MKNAGKIILKIIIAISLSMSVFCAICDTIGYGLHEKILQILHISLTDAEYFLLQIVFILIYVVSFVIFKSLYKNDK
ncbi:MAG: hypothetical protein J6C61_05420 [Clostridia bacterium]|nr:hypothetical protein [Clostridia bacterium]